jgi:hypothetical protein
LAVGDIWGTCTPNEDFFAVTSCAPDLVPVSG